MTTEVVVGQEDMTTKEAAEVEVAEASVVAAVVAVEEVTAAAAVEVMAAKRVHKFTKEPDPEIQFNFSQITSSLALKISLETFMHTRSGLNLT